MVINKQLAKTQCMCKDVVCRVLKLFGNFTELQFV